MPETLPNPLYYLDNFERVVSWVSQHHRSLLMPAEHDVLRQFGELPQPSRALLVRMIMRKGEVFRASKLRYAEVGCPLAALQPLVAQGLVDKSPSLTATQVFGLLTRAELAQQLARDLLVPCSSKAHLLEQVAAARPDAMPFGAWCPASHETVVRLSIRALCERLQLMFFGNARQDWSEFVLTDLGIFRYEAVAFSPASRAFHTRQEVNAYLHLHHCVQRLEAGEPPGDITADVPGQPYENSWLEARRGKVLFRLALQYERAGSLPEALRIHAQNSYPGARARAIRMLERLGQPEAAFELASHAAGSPESESESQQLGRVLPRLARALGLGTRPCSTLAQAARIDMTLPMPVGFMRVESAVQHALAEPGAPVYYVENTLLNALFGLLCWDAIYAALPGAFFHPFHAAPADLHRPDFQGRRASLFAACLARLDSGEYQSCIRRAYQEKQGIQSPFVAWQVINEQLLEEALHCLPAPHLKIIFKRLMSDIPNNRAGLPDLIQLWPAKRQYRMIEVKGPGDRLQDNQRRWLNHFVVNGLPVAVCYVRWTQAET